MNMRFFLISFLILSSVALIGQTSSVTATITDPDSQTWNNGSYTISFIPTPGISPGSFSWNGVLNFPQNYTGTLSAGGVLTISIPDNNFVKPLGSKWQFTLCSNTSAPCQNVVTTVTGATPNLSTTLSNALKAPRFGPGQFAFGYSDVEVGGALLPGMIYFNVTSTLQRIWTGTVWVNNGGGVAGNPATPLGSLQGNNAGVFGGVPNTTANFSTGAIGLANGNSLTFSNSGTSTALSEDSSNNLNFVFSGSGALVSPQFEVPGCGAGTAVTANGTGSGCILPLSTTPPASQDIVQPCSGSPCQSTRTSANNFANVRIVTPSWNFSVTPSSPATISAGSVAITLPCSSSAPCPLGLDTSPTNYVYAVYLTAGSGGTAEAAIVTGGTCVAGGTSSCTVIVTANQSHGTGYLVQSSTAGVQEAYNDAWHSDSGIGPMEPTVQLMPEIQYNVFSTIYLRGRFGIIDGKGALLYCTIRDRCIYLGTSAAAGGHRIHDVRIASGTVVGGVQVTSASASSGTITITTAATHPFLAGDTVACEIYSQTSSSNYVSKVLSAGLSSTQFEVIVGASTYLAGATTFGWCALLNAAIEDQSESAVIENVSIYQTCLPTCGQFTFGIVDDNDQHLTIRNVYNTGTNIILSSANFPNGAMFFSRTDQGNAGIMYIRDSEISNANYFTGGDNGVIIDNGVCQGETMFCFRYFGGLQASVFANNYLDQGNVNPLYSIAAVATTGLLVQGGNGARVVGNLPLTGTTPLLSSGGSSQRTYYVVPRSSSMGYGPVLLAGYALPTSGSVSIPVQWPSIELQDGFSRTSIGTLTWDVLVTTGTSPAPFGTGNFAIATGISGSCANGMCSFTDTQASPSSYTVHVQQFFPQFWFWPSNITNNAIEGLSPTFVDEFPRGGVVISASGTQAPAIIAAQCPPGGISGVFNPIWFSCTMTGDVNGAWIPNNTNGQAANSKGLVNFGAQPSGVLPYITLIDSNFSKTTATAGGRPSGDTLDSEIGGDVTNGIYLRGGVSIDDYIGVVPNGSNWQRQLNSSGQTLNVSETNTTLTPGETEITGPGGLRSNVANEPRSSGFTSPTLVSLLQACPASPTPCHIILDPSSTAINVPLEYSTTITAAITVTGSQAVTVASTSGAVVGMPFWINGSDNNKERVLITAIGSGTITGNFTLVHVNGSTVAAGAFIGSTTQQIIVEDNGVALKCTGTVYSDCIVVGDFGSLTCKAKSGTTNGCNITAASTFVGSSLLTNAAHDGLGQTDFTLKGFNFQPGASASCDRAELWLVAIEGKGIIQDNGGLSTSTCPIGVSVEDGPVTGSNNNLTFINNAFYENGSSGGSGAISYQVISGTGNGSGSVISFYNTNGADGEFGSGCADTSGGNTVGCMMYFDGSAAFNTSTNTYQTGMVTHFLQSITVNGLYVESTGVTVGTGNGVVIKNVKNFTGHGWTFNGGHVFNDCVLIPTPYNSNLFTQDISFDLWIHSTICSNGFAVQNQQTGTSITAASQPIMHYNYPGTASQNVTGQISDGNTTAMGFYLTSLGTAIASAGTIAPVTQTVHVTGTTTINTITVPAGIATWNTDNSPLTLVPCVQLIPDGLWSTGTGGNIAIASTAVVSKVLTECYDSNTSKWYPSY